MTRSNGFWDDNAFLYISIACKPSLAKAEKAFKAIETYLDYVVKLHDDILEKFPPGVLPEAKYMTQRDKEEIDKLLKGPSNGGKHIYTVAWPC